MGEQIEQVCSFPITGEFALLNGLPVVFCLPLSPQLLQRLPLQVGEQLRIAFYDEALNQLVLHFHEFFS
ncbi:hypothetical protein [Pedobacter alluvionis]|uniref:Uncharacterized protein n=1 Tax=Pedobacter alluvionis TaxID=475253 RepID=A0ABY2HTE8_9SPHI|nr:hypothetical protein [Pedobacter alluvionis]TFB31733.1 hypothetical protein E3V97_14215 [Pedobacter alluvionis]